MIRMYRTSILIEICIFVVIITNLLAVVNAGPRGFSFVSQRPLDLVRARRPRSHPRAEYVLHPEETFNSIHYSIKNSHLLSKILAARFFHHNILLSGFEPTFSVGVLADGPVVFSVTLGRRWTQCVFRIHSKVDIPVLYMNLIRFSFVCICDSSFCALSDDTRCHTRAETETATAVSSCRTNNMRCVQQYKSLKKLIRVKI